MRMRSCRFMPVLLCLIILMWLQPGNASESKVLAMGGTGFYVPNYTNVMPFPGTLLGYERIAYSELRVKNVETTFSVGVHLPVRDGDVFGLYLNRNLNSSIHPGIVIPTTPDVSSTDDFGLTHAVDMMYGFKLGGNNAGIRLSIGLDGSQQDSVFFPTFQETDETATFLELAGGLSNDLYDIGVALALPSVESTFGDITNKWGGLGISLNGRMRMDRGNVQYVPVLAFNVLGTTEELDTVKTDEGRVNLAFGGGALVDVTEEHTLILAIEAFSVSGTSFQFSTGESSTSVATFPGFYLGVNSQVRSWLDLRFGASHVSQQSTFTFKPDGGSESKLTSKESRFAFSAGCGFHLGNFDLDFLFNEHFFFEGPEFISGQGATAFGDLITRISMSYNWN